MFTVVIFLIVLAVLIFVHELGHFLAARACGIRVDSFKIGFGPKVFAWTPKKRDPKTGALVPGETEYGLNWIPFGGYVKIFGEDPNDENTNGPDRARSFVHKNRSIQVIVLVAGILFNFLFAWVLYAGVFATGVTASTDGFEQYAKYESNPHVIITDIVPGSPADKAGLKVGDTIIYGDGPGTSIPESTEHIQSLASLGKPFDIDYFRNGDLRGTSVGVTPTMGIVPGKYAIGIAMDTVVDLKLPFFSAIGVGFTYTLTLIKETAVGIYTFIAQIFQGQPDFSQVAGPVGIAGIVGNAAAMGFTYLVMVTAIISVNLGVVNLIPFPALDGGRVLFVVLEGVFRRRIPAKFANVVNTVGFALLMLLMVVVTYKDIAKLVS